MRWLPVLCGAAGMLLLAQAGWIHAKALVAQVLIAHAWERTQGGAPDAKPWPWADTRPIARLTFVDRSVWPLTVLAGTSARNLAFGPTHDLASAPPGDAGNTVIAGHRDTHFAVLRDAAPGDRLLVERSDGTRLAFTVTDVRVVDSRAASIALDSARPRLTLVTCYPFDAVRPGGPLRFIVTADIDENSTRFTPTAPGR